MRHSTIANIPGGGMRAGKGFSVSLKATFGRWDGGEGEPGVPGPGSGLGLQYGVQYFADRQSYSTDHTNEIFPNYST